MDSDRAGAHPVVGAGVATFARADALTPRPQTPYFTFDPAAVHRAHADFVASFPGADVFFAMKANSHPEVLAAVDACQSGFEVASAYELELLSELGVEPGRI